MSRIIRLESASRDRTKLLRWAGAALLRLRAADVSGAERRDILAFLCLTLKQVAASVDKTASSWESRSYWVKGDRFRGEWEWAGVLAQKLSQIPGKSAHELPEQVAAELSARLETLGMLGKRVHASPWHGAEAGMKRLEATGRR
ncbi:MAG TPA: hypothetical protein VJ123_07830 [Anaerolineales bacterium]|nr:hypothetical protein [Anaerolineales bacterium]